MKARNPHTVNTSPRRCRPASAILPGLATVLTVLCQAGGGLAAVHGQAALPTMDEVVVTASRVPEAAKETTGYVTVITAREIQASPAANLGDLLAEKGIGHVHRYPGALTSIGIRGFRTDTHGNDLNSHVLILLNGRRAGTGNLAKILTANIERVEIIRGPGAVQYGSAAMGGVVNVITRRAKKGTFAKATGSLASFGDNRGELSLGAATGRFDLAAGISRSSMDDYQTGSGVTFHNSGYSGITGYSANLGFTPRPGHRLGFIFNRFDGDHLGNPGYLNANDLDDYKNSSNTSSDFLYQGEADGKSWLLRYFTGRDQDAWHDPTASDPSGWDNNIPYTSKTDQQGAQAQFTSRLFSTRITTGLDWQHNETDTSSTPAKSTYDDTGVFLLAKKQFAERLIIDAGLRYDRYEVEVVEPAGRTEKDSRLIPSLGAAWLLTDQWRLRAHYGEAFMMPAAKEMAADFTSWGTRYLGNPDLKPEKSRTWEAGVDYSAEQLTARLDYFFTRYTDKIETASVGGNKTWRNVGVAELAGFEGELERTFTAPLGLHLSLTPYLSFVYMDRYRDKENHKPLLYVNRWHAAYGLKLLGPEQLSARLNFTYHGEQRIKDWETTHQEMDWGGFTVADLTISKEIFVNDRLGALTLTGEVTNLFDIDYAYVKGYPMPGRSIGLKLSYSYQ